MLESHLKQLQKELELDEPFISQAPGTWVVPLDEGLEVVVTARQPQGFSLESELGELPKEDQESFLDNVMLSNLFGQGTDGAILGLDEKEKNITIAFHSDEDVDYTRFRDILEDFISSVDVWRDEILMQKGDE